MTKYYKCPVCNDITTDEEILEECANGGAGMCYCEFDNGRQLNEWKRISFKEYLKIKGITIKEYVISKLK